MVRRRRPPVVDGPGAGGGRATCRWRMGDVPGADRAGCRWWTGDVRAADRAACRWRTDAVPEAGPTPRPGGGEPVGPPAGRTPGGAAA